jgi:pimeloyl-ACP methyl ester carboxylesterase
LPDLYRGVGAKRYTQGNPPFVVSTVWTRDGRALTYEQFGDLEGRPVVVMHGTPGSRVGPRPRAARLYPLGIRLISYDRPGYGGSDRLAGRAVAHAAADVADLADSLGIERFAVVGRSGGAPHALACAALLPERVTRVAALVAVAPYTLMGPGWYDGMTRSNVVEYSKAEAGSQQLEPYLAGLTKEIRDDPEAHLPFEENDLTKPDRAVMADYGIRAMLLDNFSEALRATPAGWIDDSLSFVRAWGFDPGVIRGEVRLWHGTEDIYAPVSHTEWLGAHIPGAQVVIQRGAGHFDSIKKLPSILGWLST